MMKKMLKHQLRLLELPCLFSTLMVISLMVNIFQDQYIFIHDCINDALEKGMHLGVSNVGLDSDSK